LAKISIDESITRLEAIIKTNPEFYNDRERLVSAIKSYNLCLESLPEKTLEKINTVLNVTPPSTLVLAEAKNSEQIIKVYWEKLHDKSQTLLEIVKGNQEPQEITERERALVDLPKELRDIILETSEKIRKLEEEKKVEPGLYYIVLIDLVGSTAAAGQLDPQENIDRNNKFIEFTRNAINNNSRNSINYLLQQKDASLILFSNFEDILDWQKQVMESLKNYNDECDREGKDSVYKMYCKIAIQAGEVHFYKADPIALAVDQVFKIEKYLVGGNFAITDRVREVILPRINSGKLISEKLTEIKIDGEENSKPLWHISIKSE